MVALAISADQRPQEVVVRSAYQAKWWRVFRQAVLQLPSAQQQRFWRAHYRLDSGQYARALHDFRSAGQQGQLYAEHLMKGQNILRGLQQTSLAQRWRAILEWEKWQDEHPGPWRWQENGSLVKAYSGAETLYSVDRDLYAQFYRAKPANRLKLVVLGPTRIKLEARPVHGGPCPPLKPPHERGDTMIAP